MLKPINTISIQQIQSTSTARNEQKPIATDPNTEADSHSPIISTAEPNQASVSCSEYQNFNVDLPGVVLQSGPTVRIILHKVIRRMPSQFNGLIKIAGQPAQLIFSNQNGINFWGCNFLETRRIVLTTGEPILSSDGNLGAFRVRTGHITIKDVTTLKHFNQIDLIAYSIKIDGKLYANKINVSAGAHQVNYTNLGIPIITRQQEL